MVLSKGYETWAMYRWSSAQMCGSLPSSSGSKHACLKKSSLAALHTVWNIWYLYWKVVTDSDEETSRFQVYVRLIFKDNPKVRKWIMPLKSCTKKCFLWLKQPRLRHTPLSPTTCISFSAICLSTKYQKVVLTSGTSFLAGVLLKHQNCNMWAPVFFWPWVLIPQHN